MADDKHIVKFWRGTRDAYNALGAAKTLDYWTRYSVTEPDGRKTEYFGTRPVGIITGNLYPVIDVVEALPSTLNVGDRYLVGHDGTFNEDGTVATEAEYYVVEIAADMSQSVINPLGKHSVRIASQNYKNYQVINNVLSTYDCRVIDCGTY